MLVFPQSTRTERNFPLLTEIGLCQAKMKHGLLIPNNRNCDSCQVKFFDEVLLDVDGRD